MRETPHHNDSSPWLNRSTQEIRRKLLDRFRAAGAVIITVPVTRRRKGWQDVPRFLDMLDKFEEESAKTSHRVD